MQKNSTIFTDSRSPLGTPKIIKNHQKVTLGRSWGPAWSLQGPSTPSWPPKCRLFHQIATILSKKITLVLQSIVESKKYCQYFSPASPTSPASPASPASPTSSANPPSPVSHLFTGCGRGRRQGRSLRIRRPPQGGRACQG